MMCCSSQIWYFPDQVRVMSMEVDSVEDFFGPDAFIGLKAMIRQQWEVNGQRIRNILAVRKVRRTHRHTTENGMGWDNKEGL